MTVISRYVVMGTASEFDSNESISEIHNTPLEISFAQSHQKTVMTTKTTRQCEKEEARDQVYGCLLMNTKKRNTSSLCSTKQVCADSAAIMLTTA